MRDAAFACIRRIGVETGGSNVQFAVDPADGRHGRHRDEPAGVAARRALASKATGFPIAKIAARLAVGYTPRRDPQRHHRADAGQLRADHRLRRHQGARAGRSRSSPASPTCSAPGCSRWARPWPSAGRSPSRCRRALRSLEHGRLGPQLRSRPRRLSTTWPTTSWCAGPRSPPPTGPSSSRRRCAGASRVERLARGHRGRPVVPRPDRADRRRAGPAGRASAARRRMTGADWRRAKRLGFSDAQLA